VSDVALTAGCPISLILVQRLVDAQNLPGLKHVWIQVGLLMPLLTWFVSLGIGFLLAGGVRRGRRVGVGLEQPGRSFTE
jgi:hypothetical protein